MTGEIEARKAQAQARFDALVSGIVDKATLLDQAIGQRDWETLGYASIAGWWNRVCDIAVERTSPAVRARLAQAMRDEGGSLRTIADELKISYETVRRDLAQVSHDVTPEPGARTAVITGRDGKSYPVHQPRIVIPARAEPVTAPPPTTAEVRQARAAAEASADTGPRGTGDGAPADGGRGVAGIWFDHESVKDTGHPAGTVTYIDVSGLTRDDGEVSVGVSGPQEISPQVLTAALDRAIGILKDTRRRVTGDNS